MRLDPQLAALIAATTGAGLLMVFSGVFKSVLEWRNRGRFCPSCGREIRHRTCRCTRADY
jgi:NADH pyrophosphatase NudC (nudix superfamily)